MVAALHAIANLRATAGGPPRSVAALTRELAAHGHRVGLFSVRTEEPEVSVDAGVTRFLGSRPGYFAGRLGFDAGLSTAAEIGESITAFQPDVVHAHGIWTPACHAVASAVKRRLPWVVSVRGMLEPWALRHAVWKKRAAWLAFQRRDLVDATAIHATSDAEVQAIRGAGLRQPIILIPNGIYAAAPKPRVTTVKEKRLALCLSRLHPKKGIPLLIEAWHRVRPEGWRLAIVGNDDGGHVELLRDLIRSRGLTDTVALMPPASDDDKWGWYARADLFILPTYSENFGMVVAEAMLAGLPVITTHGAPWRLLETTGSGWWVPITADSIAEALAEATLLEPGKLADIGRQAASTAHMEFAWNRLVARFIAAYAWLAGSGSCPACVHVV